MGSLPRLPDSGKGVWRAQTCHPLPSLANCSRARERYIYNRMAKQTEDQTGPRILREWRGETYEIMVTESGYEYRAASYRSLSEIARKITGTRWSGPAFLRLKDKSSLRGHSDA
jgi:Protein of unknown function (DUF2924)